MIVPGSTPVSDARITLRSEYVGSPICAGTSERCTCAGARLLLVPLGAFGAEDLNDLPEGARAASVRFDAEDAVVEQVGRVFLREVGRIHGELVDRIGFDRRIAERCDLR